MQSLGALHQSEFPHRFCLNDYWSVSNRLSWTRPSMTSQSQVKTCQCWESQSPHVGMSLSNDSGNRVRTVNCSGSDWHCLAFLKACEIDKGVCAVLTLPFSSKCSDSYSIQAWRAAVMDCAGKVEPAIISCETLPMLSAVVQMSWMEATISNIKAL